MTLPDENHSMFKNPSPEQWQPAKLPPKHLFRTFPEPMWRSPKIRVIARSVDRVLSPEKSEQFHRRSHS
jgi:hypothetical protein